MSVAVPCMGSVVNAVFLFAGSAAFYFTSFSFFVLARIVV